MAKDDDDHIRGRLVAEEIEKLIAEGCSKLLAWDRFNLRLKNGDYEVGGENRDGTPFVPPDGCLWPDARYAHHNTFYWPVGPAPGLRPRRIVRSPWLGYATANPPAREAPPKAQKPVTAWCVRVRLKEPAPPEAGTGALTGTQAPDTVAATTNAPARQLAASEWLPQEFKTDPCGPNEAPGDYVERILKRLEGDPGVKDVKLKTVWNLYDAWLKEQQKNGM